MPRQHATALPLHPNIRPTTRKISFTEKASLLPTNSANVRKSTMETASLSTDSPKTSE